MKQFLIFVFSFLTLSATGQEQQGLQFLENRFDFGAINEAEGPVIHEFKFINQSGKPVKILSVKASCGCTTPDWTREEVAPGESGFIQAQYNPKNRPGTFNKSLTVMTSLNNQPIRLYIRGNVVPKPKSIEEELPTMINGLRVKYGTVNMGRVFTNNQPVVKVFDVYNDTDSIMIFQDKVEAPEYISLAFDPAQLAPKSKGQIKVSFTGKEGAELGFANDQITFYTNQQGELAEKSISVFATVLEYFPPMTAEELSKAPQLTVDEDTHEFGKINADQTVSTTFTLLNNGKSPLLIRKVDGNCECIAAELDKEKIKPGKSIELKVTFDPVKRKGNQQKSITIYSNDPRNSVARLTIKAYID